MGNRRGRQLAREEEEDRVPDPWTQAPVNITQLTNTNATKATIEAVDLAFLNEFAGADLNSITGDDITMNNDTPPAEENVTT